MTTTFVPATARPRSPEDAGAGRLAFINAALEKAWSRGWFSRPELEPDSLIRAARRDSGLHAFGPDHGWRDRLDWLVEALHGEARLSALGRTIAYGQIVAALSNRLRASALWERHPAIADWPITAPVIIVGQMRSGSTRVQRLLACDDRLAHTRFFESWNPFPRWPGIPFDDRRLRGWLALAVAKTINPRFNIVHPSRVSQADEEIGLHNIAFYGSAFEAQWRIPSFARHCEAMDSRPVYAEFRRMLQSIAWMRGGAGRRPWIMKVPQFTQDLDAVLSTFPDARLIVLNRDPVRVVGSSASLVRNQMEVQSHTVDQGWIGQEWLRKTALRAARSRRGLASFDGPCVTLDFDAMQEDWVGEMGRVYAMLDLPFTRRARHRMTRFLKGHSSAQLHRHHYDVADFGLTPDGIRAALAH